MLSFCQRFIMKIQSDNIGHKTRLRNRFVNEGMENFEPHEVLEVMLYKSFPYSDTNALAHRLIDRFGSFAAVLEAPYTELEKVEGMGRSSAITLSMWRVVFQVLRAKQKDRAQRAVHGRQAAADCVGVAERLRYRRNARALP